VIKTGCIIAMVRPRWKEWCEVDAVDTKGFQVIQVLLNSFEVPSKKLYPCCCISSARGIFPLTGMGPVRDFFLDI
jgi:hypothetical protein